MKKKVLTAVLPICVAMAMTACGGNADTEEVKETAIIEEDTEADAQAEAETEAKAREEAEQQARLEEADECYEAGRKSLYGLDGAQIDLEDAYTNFKKAQELGNSDANFYLGALADWYKYPEQDFEQAREYYEQCEDNPYAQISLGFLYYYAQVEWNEENWVDGQELFQSVVDQGVVEGYLGLAAVARDEQDYETALEYYQKVAEEGTEQLYTASAMKSLGDIYQYGDTYGVEQDDAKVIEWYTKAAELGNSDAMFDIGVMYRDGDGVAQDYDAALEWFQKAAGQDNIYAAICMGHMYRFGQGVAQDGNAALEWYTKAADLGDSSALNEIGDMYLGGHGVEKDSNAALEWYTKAADLDDSVAMEKIGDMYLDGNGVEQDNDKALEWYVKSLFFMPDYMVYEKIADILHGEDAAEKWFEESGDAEKMIALANMYRSFYGIGEEQLLPDFDKAIEWYTKAAELGNSDAMSMLGYMYEMAPVYGGEQDLDKAVEWYQKAADLGNEEAQSQLEALQGQ